MAKFDSAPESLQLRARIQQHLAAAQDARLAARAGDREALEDAAYHDNQVALLREKLRRMGHRPNPTDRRLFKSLAVFSKFPPEEREGLRLALIEIVFNSIGIDHYDRRATSDELLEEYGTDARLTGKSVIDGCVPWLARRLAKERFADQREADATLDALKRGFRKLCTWATETRQNLDSYSLLDALEESQGYQSFAQRKGKEESDVNPTLYRFADGWKVVELRTKKALEREGDLMDHCVGGYCEQVERGESRIFSLRDPDNKPHVTMEYQPEDARFEQIYGPSNEEPEDYTLPYLREFLEEKFDGEPNGLLQAGVSPKELNLQGANLRDVNLQDADLRGVNLRGADLQEANLQDADLRGADLRGAGLLGADFSSAKLQGAKLQGADLRWADLRGAYNLAYANLRNAIYNDKTLWPSNFDPDVAGAYLISPNSALQGAYLQDANLRGANLVGADLRGADLRGVYLQGAKLWRAQLQGAKLQGAYYDDGTDWPRNFDPDVAGAYLISPNSDLQGANLRGADLPGARFRGADLQGTNLRGARFRGADLQGAKLQGARLQGAKLQGARLQGAKLQGAFYNDETVWPDGFDPDEAGAVYED